MQKSEREQIKKLISKKNIPTFRPGDTLKVTVKIMEGERSRLQAFEGVCIARKNNSVNSKFTVRKVSHGEGVERVFPLFSPIIDKIEVVRKGNVNRAKLYYLRDRTGKRARIADSDRGEEKDQYIMSEDLENTDSDQTSLEKKELVEEVPPEPSEEPVVEENKPIEEKSESTATQAEKTKDESKS